MAAAFPSRYPAYAFPPKDAAKAGFDREHQVFSVISSCFTDASMGGCELALLVILKCEANAYEYYFGNSWSKEVLSPGCSLLQRHVRAQHGAARFAGVQSVGGSPSSTKAESGDAGRFEWRRHWPVRSYPWGVAEALHSTHSDMPALKRLLIELSFEDLKARTEQRYYSLRAYSLELEEKHRATSSGSSAGVWRPYCLLAPAHPQLPRTLRQSFGKL